MYCKYCGSEIKGNFCSNCGRKVQEESKESSGFGYGVLGFFFPLIGFILFLVYLNEKKKASRASLIGCITGVLVKALLVMFALFVFSYGIGGAADCYEECGYNFEYRNGQCVCTDNNLDIF